MKNIFKQYRDLLRSAPSVIVALYFISVIWMNLLANKSINLGVDWLAMDCGIFFSWLTFLAMDVLTQCYGPKLANMLAFAALLSNLLVAFIFYIASIVPGTWGESYVPGSEDVINAALDGTINGTWYVLFGSSMAFLFSAIVNNFCNHAIGRKVGRNKSFREFALRSYPSTMLAQFVDNLTFALIVSKNFFGWSLTQCFMCAFTGAVIELLFEILFSPLGYRIARSLMSDGEQITEQELNLD